MSRSRKTRGIVVVDGRVDVEDVERVGVEEEGAKSTEMSVHCERELASVAMVINVSCRLG